MITFRYAVNKCYANNETRVGVEKFVAKPRRKFYDKN